MNVWKSLSVLAVASALAAGAPSARALAGDSVLLRTDDPASSQIDESVLDSDAALNSDASALPQSVSFDARDGVVAIRGFDLDGSPQMLLIEQTEGPVLRGHVAEVDPDSGRLILATERGLIDVFVSPADAERVQVGDVLLVAFVER